MLKYTTSAILMGLLMAGCANMSDEKSDDMTELLDDPRVGEKVNEICFNRAIDGFSNATRESVVLSKGPSDDYLVLMRGSCFDLDRAQSIALDSDGSCLRKFDSLLVSQSVFGTTAADTLSAPLGCPIDTIYKWNEDAIEEDSEDDDN